ncbi:siderophore ABC transporter substrate-binding protein [Cryobacterium sp. PH29-G1]|uniref:siderophore ABC transporter substrate-binding protein n=1 Tax=Cryobacterium sp. PH29-G1 TaxID=3046211 RepID=UPI0024BAB6CF|nr:siderophore ABC transporter substrate-binding protein [Cryobacterium sp. PH29-G1]MDJ0350783.1 siderophore ABC transporter substrate-binding protein [Cryobacterium sp. PH29-G1]
MSVPAPRTQNPKIAKRSAFAVAAAATLALLVSGCTSAEPAPAAVETAEVTVSHAQGETTVPVNPTRVLTFDIAALTTLDALGVDVLGVPKANLPGELEKFNTDAYENIGTLFEPDYEAVNAANPDLIIVAGRSAAVYPELSKIAPTIDLSNDAADFAASVIAGAETLGTIFDKEAEVAAMVDSLDASVAEVTALAKDAGTALIVMTNAGEISAFGPGSRFGFLHDSLGVTPAVADVEAATHGEAVSFEFLLETDPDWLFVVDRDSAIASGTGNAHEVLDNAIVHETSAWQNDQIVYVDPVAWYIVNGGLSNLQNMTDEVATALAP